jgi:uncharacterized membrane protein (DUF485 family)
VVIFSSLLKTLLSTKKNQKFKKDNKKIYILAIVVETVLFVTLCVIIGYFAANLKEMEFKLNDALSDFFVGIVIAVSLFLVGLIIVNILGFRGDLFEKYFNQETNKKGRKRAAAQLLFILVLQTAFLIGSIIVSMSADSPSLVAEKYMTEAIEVWNYNFDNAWSIEMIRETAEESKILLDNAKGISNQYIDSAKESANINAKIEDATIMSFIREDGTLTAYLENSGRARVPNDYKRIINHRRDLLGRIENYYKDTDLQKSHNAFLLEADLYAELAYLYLKLGDKNKAGEEITSASKIYNEIVNDADVQEDIRQEAAINNIILRYYAYIEKVISGGKFLVTEIDLFQEMENNQKILPSLKEIEDWGKMYTIIEEIIAQGVK